MLLAPMRTLGWTLGLTQRATASGARLFELLDREPRIIAAPDATPLPAGSGRVELRDVTLAYGDDADSHAEPALHDVSLTVEAGTTLALVGATGSGKTTLVQLIPRLYDPTSGAVLVDGADVRTRRPARAARADRGRQRRPVPLQRVGPREHRLRASGRDAARRSSRPPAARRRTTSSPRCRTATTRASASAA